MLRPTNAGAATSALFEMKKGAVFSVRQDQQNDAQVFVSFLRKIPLPAVKNATQKGRWLNASARKGKTPGSNRGRRSETAICIYGLKERIRARKSPETVGLTVIRNEITYQLLADGFRVHTKLPSDS